MTLEDPRNTNYWTFWADPDCKGWMLLEDFPCGEDILAEAECRGWTGDNGWESCDDPGDDQSELAEANEYAALKYIWDHIVIHNGWLRQGVKDNA